METTEEATDAVSAEFTEEAVEEAKAEAEDDVKNGRVAPMTETFDDLRKMLQEG